MGQNVLTASHSLLCGPLMKRDAGRGMCTLLGLGRMAVTETRCEPGKGT